MIDNDLLHMIRCPETGCRLFLGQDNAELWSRGSKKAYPIKNGIPILIISQARCLNDSELNVLEKSISKSDLTGE